MFICPFSGLHVKVAQLLLDLSGGHLELAALLIKRGAKLEEVIDEGYIPLIEAAREGHEEMEALLLAQAANINCRGRHRTGLLNALS
ncbi:ankyrin repeat and KH domain-containing protein 1-like [Salmo trutta]|uniref:ankyrin repeat and KH domain-containing protein 1-like n=1 Tax=Salmo trutta TaxID=8032 RepID=UPI00112FF020|nr:ankyrin repeat and KH domain-containing protein 1-like [Salmo trutta]